MKRVIIVFTLLLFFNSCYEVRTSNPKEVYTYWSGSKPPEDLEVINGQYWQSAHWTMEYIMSLKIKPSENWWNEFIVQNKLEIDTARWTEPSDLPNWFNPSGNSIRYKINSEFDQGSRYFQDKLSGECYIYEIQF